MSHRLFLTTQGRAKIAAAANDERVLRLTDFAVGSGRDVDFAARLDKNTLVAKRYQGKIASITAVSGVLGQYEIDCVVPQDIGGFAIREFGLLDDAGALVYVGTLPEVVKPDAGSIAALDYRIKAIVQIDNPLVSIVIDANVVTATRAWVESHFVLQSVFNDHVRQNSKEHDAFRDWQAAHNNADNPHPQYALLSTLEEIINTLNQKITLLESKAISGVQVAKLTVDYYDARLSKNDFSGEGRVSVHEEWGFVFDYPKSYSLGIFDHSGSENIYIGLPAEYDNAKHRLSVVTNGNYELDYDSRQLVFTFDISTNRDGEGVLSRVINANITISVFNQ